MLRQNSLGSMNSLSLSFDSNNFEDNKAETDDDSLNYDKYEKIVKAEKTDGNKVYLAQTEYSRKELEQFNCERPKWTLKCKGSQQFTADSDSGEDAYGYYCRYFDLMPEKAVFENGKLVGVYLCNYSISYSGNGRYDFSIDDWGSREVILSDSFRGVKKLMYSFSQMLKLINGKTGLCWKRILKPGMNHI